MDFKISGKPKQKKLPKIPKKKTLDNLERYAEKKAEIEKYNADQKREHENRVKKLKAKLKK